MWPRRCPPSAWSTNGATNEGRPLLVAIVSSAENMARLEDLRTNNLKLTGLMEGASSGPTPALVWLSYNVHGNESVSTEAALATLYDLADSNNARTQAWLVNTVVILDPCINPDGRDRYVAFYNRTVGRFPNAAPDAREHHEPWPGGCTNHYYFDLNRDWAWATQLETQQRLALYHRWMPHIHVDFHEQGVNSPYYFTPAAEPYHEAITPWQRELQTIIGRNHARYFDPNAWLYFTRQVFDLFYPGYGDTWPTFNGAVGMTYEQGGGGRGGLGIVTAEGDTLTLRDRIDITPPASRPSRRRRTTTNASFANSNSSIPRLGRRPPGDTRRSSSKPPTPRTSAPLSPPTSTSRASPTATLQAHGRRAVGPTPTVLPAPCPSNPAT